MAISCLESIASGYLPFSHALLIQDIAFRLLGYLKYGKHCDTTLIKKSLQLPKRIFPAAWAVCCGSQLPNSQIIHRLVYNFFQFHRCQCFPHGLLAKFPECIDTLTSSQCRQNRHIPCFIILLLSFLLHHFFLCKLLVPLKLRICLL